MDGSGREDLVSAGSWLASQGLAPGSSGNASVRVSGGWLMTPTGTALGDLDSDHLAHLDTTGRLVSGSLPSKESQLHLAVYEARPSAGAVVHLHSTYAVALACRADLDPDQPLPPITPYQVMRVFPMALIPYALPGSLELAKVVRVGAARAPALLLANHGSVVAAATLKEALFAANEFEEAAKVRFLLDGYATRPLEPDEVEDIRRSLKR